MGKRTITRALILAIRTDAHHTGRWPDQTMTDACNACLWELDGNGELHPQFYSRSAERVRAAIEGRIGAGELFAHA